MTKNNLIALVDASAYARSVCDHAAWIAGRMDATVTFYHVMGRRTPPDKKDLSGAIRLGARSQLLDELATLDEARGKLAMEHGRAILEDARAIVEAAGVPVETRLRHGDLVEVITDKENDAAMIIVGKRGEAAGLAAAHLGSNLERIVRASHKPVFIANREFRSPSKVLIAFDGGASSMKAVDYLSRSAICADLSVTLVHAGPDSPSIRKSLENAAALLTGGNIQSNILVRDGRPEAVLGALIEEEGYDLVVMGAYGHSRIRSLIIGSTTSEMIRTCKVPVFIMR